MTKYTDEEGNERRLDSEDLHEDDENFPIEWFFTGLLVVTLCCVVVAIFALVIMHF